MSNPALLKMLRGNSGMQSFHVGSGGAPPRDDAGVVRFNGERFAFSASAKSEIPDFSKKENREEKSGGKKGKKDEKDSDSEDDSGAHFGKGDTSGKNGFPGKGSDGDGDGKKNEKKKKPSFADKDRDGKPDAFEKKK